MKITALAIWILILSAVTFLKELPGKYMNNATQSGMLRHPTTIAGDIIEGAIQRGVAKFSYDFDIQGGAQGDITLAGEPLPKNAIVWDGVVDVITALVGSGASAAVSTSQSANDLITSAAISGAPWSTTGSKALVPVGDAAHSIKMTADRAPKLVIASADLTAGKFNLFIEYYLSD